MKTNSFKALLTILLLLCSLTVSGHDFLLGGVFYNIISENEVEVTYEGSSYSAYTDDYEGHVIIPEIVKYAGVTYNVTSIGNDAFRDCDALTSIAVGKNVRAIKECAFMGTSSLESVHITDVAAWCQMSISVKSYGNGGAVKSGMARGDTRAIYTYIANPLQGADLYLNGNKVTDLVIPDGVTEIATFAFKGCRSIKTVTIPQSVTSVGASAFSDCASIEKVVMGNGVIEIGTSAFSNCIALVDVELSNNVAVIGASAFYACSSLANMRIPDSVVTIGSEAFYHCTALMDVSFSENVESVGVNAFSRTGWYAGQPAGLLYCSGWLLGYKGDSPVGPVEIRTGTRIVRERALAECKGITEVVVSNTVVKIGKEAFNNCTGLVSVNIADITETIGDNAFSGCTNLKDVIIGTGLKVLGTGAFESCENLKNISIGGNITSIGEGTFMGCRKLSVVNIPNSVTVIDKDAFRGCTRLETIDIPSGVTFIGEYAFSGCGLVDVKIPSGVNRIEDYTFSGCYGLSDVEIPQGVTTVGTSAFEECFGLTSVKVPASVTVMESGAFGNCNALSTVYIDDMSAWCNVDFENNLANPLCNGADLYVGDMLVSDLTIPDDIDMVKFATFYGCKSITSLTIPANVWGISRVAFKNCISLEKVNMANSVTYLSDRVFQNCASLTDVRISTGIEEIYEYTFADCCSLENISIPSNVKNIYSYAFNNCTSLAKVYSMAKTPPSIYSQTFNGASSTATLYIPAGSREAYQSVSAWNEFAQIEELELSTLYEGVNYNVLSIEDRACEVTFSGATYDEVSGEYSGSVVIPEKVTIAGVEYTVTAIGDYAFFNCPDLVSVDLPNTVTVIGAEAFSLCYDLADMTIPNSVETISSQAFSGCSSLKKMSIPSNVKEIGYLAISSCYIDSITVAADNKVYDSRDNCNAIIETATNKLIMGCANSVIPESVVSIADYAFWNCYELVKMEIPENVTTIGVRAFAYSYSLSNVTICGDDVSIDELAFMGCSGLTRIVFRTTNPPVMDANTFEDAAYSAATLYVPAEAEESFKSASHWNNFENIEGYDRTYDMCFEVLSDVSMTALIKSYIGDASFVSIPDVVEMDGKSYNVTTVGAESFMDNQTLERLFVPASIVKFEPDAFSGCENLKAVDVADLSKWCSIGFANIESNPLYNIAGFYLNGELITELQIPADVEGIKDYAFSGCSSIETLTMPDGIISVGSGSFRNCSNLSSITISGSVSGIGEQAFSRCHKLKDVLSFIPEHELFSFSRDVFDNRTYRIATLSVPLDAKAKYASTAGWSYFSNIVEFDSTGFTGVVAEDGSNGLSGVYYDLNGRVVDNPTTGIYIVNGVKVLVE